MAYTAITGNDPIAGTCLSPGERLFTVACLAAPFVGSKIAGKLGEMCRFNGGCFVAGTPVQVATLEEASVQLAKHETIGKEGKKGEKGKSSESLHTITKPIEQIHEGDLVASRNQVSGKTELRRVVATSRHTVMKLIVLSLADAKTGKVVQTLTTTAEHPFAVKGKGFVVAGQLAIGNAIVTRAGPALVVKSKQVQAQPNGVSVYNFAVDGDQTYFVGTANGGTWVHNARDCPLPNWSPKSKPTWGHTFETHGAGPKNTRGLRGRAGGKGQPEGQWCNNQDAAEFLRRFAGIDGPITTLNLPEGLGQVIRPDGSIAPARRAVIVPNPNGGFITAYPIE